MKQNLQNIKREGRRKEKLKQVTGISVVLLLLLVMLNSVFVVAPVKAQVGVPAIIVPATQRIHRLFVGYNDGDLRFAEQDADDVYQGVIKWGDGDNIITERFMWGNAPTIPQRPTYDNIKGFFDTAKANAASGDIVAFYFSGHGCLKTPGILIGDGTTHQILPADDLAEWIKEFPIGVGFLFIFDACYSKAIGARIKGTLARLGDTGRWFDWIGQTSTTPDSSWWFGWGRASYTWRRLLDAFSGTFYPNADRNGDGWTTGYELLLYTTKSSWGYMGDDDGDGLVDEDDVDHYENGSPYHLYADNDGDGNIDEDPAAKYVELGSTLGGVGGVGGVVVPVDKFGLLAPYIGFASTILVATVATSIHVKRVKRRKEK